MPSFCPHLPLPNHDGEQIGNACVGKTVGDGSLTGCGGNKTSTALQEALGQYRFKMTTGITFGLGIPIFCGGI